MEVGLLINGLEDLLATSFRSILIISVSLLVLEIYLLNINFASLFDLGIYLLYLLTYYYFCQFIDFRNLLFYYYFVSLLVLEI